MSVIFILGGSAADELNGGAFDDATAMVWANAQGDNGAALFSNNACTVDANVNDVRITRAGYFAVDLAGVYAYCDFPSNYAAGRYKIKSSDVNSITIDLLWSADIVPPSTTANVGGAVKQGAADDTTHIQAILESAVAGDTIKIQGDLDVAAELDLNAVGNAGTIGLWITLEGVNSAGVRIARTETQPIITATNESMDNILDLNLLYWQINGLSFDADNLADTGVTIGTGGDYGVIDYCEFYNSKNDGLYCNGSFNSITNCESYDNDDDGIWCGYGKNVVINCISHDNGGEGIHCYTGQVLMLNCISHGNGGAGFRLYGTSAFYTQLINCTSDNNGTYGLEIKKGAYFTLIQNCIFSNNAQYGVYFGDVAEVDSVLYVKNNNAYGNGTDPCNAGTWATPGDVDSDNVEVDPAFEADFTPTNSLIIFGGMPDVNDNPTPIGAILKRNLPTAGFGGGFN